MARTFRLTPGKVEAAQKILGAPTATETIETALDMVVFRRELIHGLEAAFGAWVSRAERKYVLDTNLFIAGLRHAEAKAQLQAFHSAFAPFEYLSAVVAQELRAGTRGGEDLRLLERHILEPFERRGRVLTPSYTAWGHSGDVLGELGRTEGLHPASATLVTENLGDFRRIRRLLPFEFVPPWPAPIS